MKKIFISLAVLVTLITTATADTTLLVPDYILDVASGKRISGQAVVVDGNRIIRIDAADMLQTQQFDHVITLAGKTLMPGLIDAHSHVLLHPYDETTWNDQVLKESRAERILRAGNHMLARKPLNGAMTPGSISRRNSEVKIAMNKAKMTSLRHKTTAIATIGGKIDKYSALFDITKLIPRLFFSPYG